MAKKPGKWLQAVQKRIEEKGTKGATHKYLGVPEDKSIPMSKLKAALKKKGLKPKTKKRLQFAKNMATLAARRKAHEQTATASTLDILTAIAGEQGLELAGAAADSMPAAAREFNGNVNGVRYRFIFQERDQKHNVDGYIGVFERWSGQSRTEREQTNAFLLVNHDEGKAELSAVADPSHGIVVGIAKFLLNARRYIRAGVETTDITAQGLEALAHKAAAKYAADPKYWHDSKDQVKLEHWGRPHISTAEAAAPHREPHGEIRKKFYADDARNFGSSVTVKWNRNVYDTEGEYWISGRNSNGARVECCLGLDKAKAEKLAEHIRETGDTKGHPSRLQRDDEAPEPVKPARGKLSEWARKKFGKAEAATLEAWAQEFGLEIL